MPVHTRIHVSPQGSERGHCLNYARAGQLPARTVDLRRNFPAGSVAGSSRTGSTGEIARSPCLHNWRFERWPRWVHSSIFWILFGAKSVGPSYRPHSLTAKQPLIERRASSTPNLLIGLQVLHARVSAGAILCPVLLAPISRQFLALSIAHDLEQVLPTAVPARAGLPAPLRARL